MSKPKRANDSNLPPHWKVRIFIKGSGILHVLSKTEPIVKKENGVVQDLQINCIADTEHGDTVGFIDKYEIGAISWRFAPLATAQ